MGDRPADLDETLAHREELFPVGGEMQGHAHARVGVGLDLEVEVRREAPGRLHGHFDDVLLAELVPHGLVLRREAQPRKEEEVGLAGDELRGPIRRVGIPVRPEAVEVGEPFAEVVGVAFELGDHAGLPADILHAAGADAGLGVAGDAVVTEGLDRVA